MTGDESAESQKTTPLTRSGIRIAILAFLLDLVLVAVFVTIGRRSHDNPFSLLPWLRVVWPFALGLLVAWVTSRAWRDPSALWPAGVRVWVITLLGAVGLRALSSQGIDPTFIVVGAAFLALFLLGWRVIYWVVTVAMRRRSPAKAVGG